MIIDCHTHINNYHDETVESLHACIENLEKAMRRNRIDISLVLTSYKVNAGRPSTRDAVRATRDKKNLFIIAGMSYLNFDPDELREVREYMQEGKVRGLKLYPGYEPFYPSDPKLHPVYDLAAEFNVPVMLHSGDTYAPSGRVKFAHPLNVDDAAVDHPNTKIVICHIGNPWIRDTMEVVYKNQNVYTDISGLVLGDFTDRFEQFMRKQLQEMLIYGVEPTKVLFGTDWPISSMETYISFMDELKIPPADKKKMMYENAVSVFDLPLEPSFARGNSLLDWLG